MVNTAPERAWTGGGRNIPDRLERVLQSLRAHQGERFGIRVAVSGRDDTAGRERGTRIPIIRGTEVRTIIRTPYPGVPISNGVSVGEGEFSRRNSRLGQARPALHVLGHTLPGTPILHRSRDRPRYLLQQDSGWQVARIVRGHAVEVEVPVVQLKVVLPYPVG